MCIKPKRSSLRIGSCAKLTPWFCGPFWILKRIGLVSYQLALPPKVKFHDVFHVSQLRKYIPDPTQEIRVEVIELRDDLTYPESPERILDRRDQALRNKVIPLVKIQWRNHTEEEATWELKDTIRKKYPHLFEDIERE